jgi:hypothetical protein
MKKRRFAFGGFSDIDEGRDTPDQALARKASDSKYASDAADKAAGLASTKGQDVGLKRLFMGNIDKPDSEAGQQFGAGRARLDSMPAAPDRKESMKNMSGFETPVRPTPRPPITIPSTPIDMAESPMLRAGTPTGPGTYKRDTEGEAASTLARESVRKTPTNAPVKPTVKRKNPTATAKKYPKGTGKETFLESIKRNKAENTDTSDMSYNKKGGSIKAYASGGSVSSRADGCAQRGKTRGMMR